MKTFHLPQEANRPLTKTRVVSSVVVSSPAAAHQLPRRHVIVLPQLAVHAPGGVGHVHEQWIEHARGTVDLVKRRAHMRLVGRRARA